jgi:hypothetical protein
VTLGRRRLRTAFPETARRLASPPGTSKVYANDQLGDKPNLILLGSILDAGKFLEMPYLRTVRNAAATIKAISFFLGPIIAGGILLGYLVTTYVRSRTALAAIAIISLFMILGTVSGFLYYVHQICDPDPYEITKIDCLLVVQRVGDHHQYTNIREQTIKARRNNVRLVEHRAHWTGQGSKSKSSSGSLTGKHEFYSARQPEEDGRTHHLIYLGRPLSKGDSEHVGFQQTFEDNTAPMHTYYREGGGRYKARDLTLTTRFSVDDEPPIVEGHVWNNDRRNRQRHEVGRLESERSADPTKGTVDYIVTVRRPKRYHSYGIRWEWLTPGTTHRSNNRKI